MVLDGFVGPGHVSMVIGIRPYDFIARDYRKPIVVAGFEPLDLLQSVLMVLEQIRDGRAEVENQYSRVVPDEGNPVSIAACTAVYQPRPSFEWRGLGEIDASGLRIRDTYSAFDAEVKFGIGYAKSAKAGAEHDGCRCGDVMTGRIKPHACPHFGKGCTPEMPLGALMVSSEGACGRRVFISILAWPSGLSWELSADAAMVVRSVSWATQPLRKAATRSVAARRTFNMSPRLYFRP